METVIAQPKKGLMASYIVFIVLGSLFAIIGVALLVVASDVFFVGTFFLALGLVFLGAGIGWAVYFARLPKNYITFNEGRLHFYNGFECSPAEINYCTSSTWGLDGALFNYGNLIISVKGQEFKFKFVYEVGTAVARLNALKTECAAVESMKKHIAEKQAAEATETASVAETAAATESVEEEKPQD